MSDWEAWLKLVDAPEKGTVLHAPPALILSPSGTRYRCDRRGRVLLVADFGKAVGCVVHCGSCS